MLSHRVFGSSKKILCSSVSNFVLNSQCCSSTKPAKPENSFLLFLKEKRQTKPQGVSTAEWVKNASEEWKQMPQFAKEPYVEEMRNSFKRYQTQKQEFLDSLDDFERDNLVHQKKSKSLARQKRKINKAVQEFGKPKRPYNGYICYVKHRLENFYLRSMDDGRRVLKQIAEEWKAMPDSRKQKYMLQANMDKERYEREMAEYISRLQLADKTDLIPASYSVAKSKNSDKNIQSD